MTGALSQAQFGRYAFPDDHPDAWTNRETYYHGTAHEYPTGHVIDPSQPHEKAGQESSSSQVYFTSDPHKASFYAERAAKAHGGRPRVYRVNPTGVHHQDHMTRRSPENRSSSRPIVVTGEHEHTDWRAAGYGQR